MEDILGGYFCSGYFRGEYFGGWYFVVGILSWVTWGGYSLVVFWGG